MLPRALLDELRCPYCGGGLALAAEVRGEGAGVSDGIVRCACGESPVLEGTLWLNKRVDGHIMGDPPAVAAALARLREGDAEGAMVEALLDAARHPLRRAATGLGRAGVRAPALLGPVKRWVRDRIVRDRTLTFARAVYLLRNRPYADYLYQRFANPSLMSAIPLILLLSGVAGGQRAGGQGTGGRGTGEPKTARPWHPRVVEIGGGAGHAAFLMGRYFPGLEVVLTDGDFSNLFMAGRYLAPGSVRICLDAEAPLPFADGSADALFSMDAFHYMRSKVAVAREMRRVAKADALWLLPHLHNALGWNPSAGYPLAPGEYLRVFAPLGVRLWPQGEVLERFAREQAVDLSRAAEPGALEKADALAMVAGPESLWRRHELAEGYFRLGPDLGLNPLLRRAADGAGDARGASGLYRPEWPSEELRAECLDGAGVIPASVRVDPGLIARLGKAPLGEAEAAEVRGLMRTFSLVPLPGAYGEAG
ncbi:MAG: class I SAM-dependent methyltransferase [Phycisphaerales bacterium]